MSLVPIDLRPAPGFVLVRDCDYEVPPEVQRYATGLLAVGRVIGGAAWGSLALYESAAGFPLGGMAIGWRAIPESRVCAYVGAEVDSRLLVSELVEGMARILRTELGAFERTILRAAAAELLVALERRDATRTPGI